MTVAAPSDRFAIWRRRVHPLLTIVIAFVTAGIVGVLLHPEHNGSSNGDDLLADVYAPSIAALVVLFVGRSATLDVLAVRLRFSQAILWIVVPTMLIIALAIVEMKVTGHSFYVVDYLIRTSDFPVWLAEQTSIALAFPILEEFIFRGVIQTELRKRIGPIVALFITAILFGFAHFEGTHDFARIALLCCVGLVFGVVRDRTDSLGAPIVVHSLYNIALAGLEFWHDF